MDLNFELILGILFSIAGLILIVYAFKNEPSKEQSESSKSSKIQMKILGIGLFIGGLFYAF